MSVVCNSVLQHVSSTIHMVHLLQVPLEPSDDDAITSYFGVERPDAMQQLPIRGTEQTRRFFENFVKLYDSEHCSEFLNLQLEDPCSMKMMAESTILTVSTQK